MQRNRGRALPPPVEAPTAPNAASSSSRLLVICQRNPPKPTPAALRNSSKRPYRVQVVRAPPNWLQVSERLMPVQIRISRPGGGADRDQFAFMEESKLLQEVCGYLHKGYEDKFFECERLSEEIGRLQRGHEAKDEQIRKHVQQHETDEKSNGWLRSLWDADQVKIRSIEVELKERSETLRQQLERVMKERADRDDRIVQLEAQNKGLWEAILAAQRQVRQLRQPQPQQRRALRARPAAAQASAPPTRGNTPPAPPPSAPTVRSRFPRACKNTSKNYKQ
ncbi:MAG: hypothetical protein Q9202_006169 [Teloschistes flavicans]